MTSFRAHQPADKKPLRVWPGVVAVALQWSGWLLVPIVAPDAAMYGFLGGIFGGGLAVLLWWLFFSRASWAERVGALVLMAAIVVATRPVLHESIRTGMMGMLFVIYSIPALSMALVVWAVASRRLPSGLRYASMFAAILLACGAFALLRTEGVTGDADSDFEWRWTPTHEQRLLARAARGPVPPPAAAPSTAVEAPRATDTPGLPPETAAPHPRPEREASPRPATGAGLASPAAPGRAAVWPGFRGPNRDGVIRGVQIATDWTTAPPVELWRRPIGPGWSSFAVRGDRLYTQEQRGEEEVVSCYRLSTGEPVWTHRDTVRFWESNGGPGPRATPTVHGNRVYTFGATGILNALDAATGALLWSRNAANDTGTETPGWGFASSPLVVDDLVIVAASGQLAAYDAATGTPRWYGPDGGSGYSSPHLATIEGVPQIILLRGSRTVSVSPADGSLLWEHTWEPGVGIVQPAVTSDRDLLLTTGDAMGGVGMRRVSLARGAGGWTVEQRWTSRGLKPYFNDFVVHDGHAYGFDGSILACVDLNDGTRKWKGGRYGHGQLLLLADQDLLLVLSEEGELALVRAAPAGFAEVARVKALEGKTWNHPVLVGQVLLVRNGEEMAAFRLPRAAGP